MARKKASPDALDALIDRASEKVRKIYKGTVSERGETALEFPSVFLTTGSLVLDRLCAGRNPGGAPIGPRQGRIIHIAGAFSTAKSLILDHLFKAAQDIGGIGLCSETEGSRDPHFAKAIGLDLHRLEVQRPATLEEGIDQGLTFHDEIRASSGGEAVPILWGLDSLDSTETLRTANDGLSQSGGWHYGGGKSEALAAGFRKIVQRTARYPTTFVLLNQTRDVVGGMPSFGPRKTTPGGNPPHFYASLEIMLSLSPMGVVRAKGQMAPIGKELARKLGLQGADKGNVVGRWVRARITKTKIAPTLFDEGDFYVDFRRGINRWGGLMQTMLREGHIALGSDGVTVTVAWENKSLRFSSQAEWIRWTAGMPAFLAQGKKLEEASREDAPEGDKEE